MMSHTTHISKIEQGRAEFAYKNAKKVAERPKNDDEQKKKYRAYCKNVPMMIKTNGLGATIAFLFSKQQKEKEKAYRFIYEQIADWLQKNQKHLIDLSDEKPLVEAVVTLNSPAYRAVTAEVLALFSWLRRFAEGLIQDEEDHQKEESAS